MQFYEKKDGIPCPNCPNKNTCPIRRVCAGKTHTLKLACPLPLHIIELYSMLPLPEEEVTIDPEILRQRIHNN